MAASVIQGQFSKFTGEIGSAGQIGALNSAGLSDPNRYEAPGDLRVKTVTTNQWTLSIWSNLFVTDPKLVLMQANENLSIDLQYNNQLISFLNMLGVLLLNELKHTYYLNLSVAFLPENR